MARPIPSQISIDDFQSALLVGAQAEEKWNQSNFYASSAGGCLRKQAYNILGYPESDPKFNWFHETENRIGDLLHERICKRLYEANMLWNCPYDAGAPYEDLTDKPVEVPLAKTQDEASFTLQTKLGLSGQIDAILRVVDPETGEVLPALLDLKSVRPKYLKRGYPYFQGKLESYFSQAQLYMHLYQPEPGLQISRCYIVVMSRGETDDMRRYVVYYSKEYCDKECERILHARNQVNAGQLPEPEPEREGGCTFCTYRSLCPSGGLM